MNVLVVSHTYISAINRNKWRELGKRYPDVNLTVVIPKEWPTTIFHHKISQDTLDKENNGNVAFIALNSFFHGNEVRYFYNPLQLIKVLRTAKPDIIHVEQGAKALSYFQCILIAKLLRLSPKFIFFTWINWAVPKTRSHKFFWNHIEHFNLKHSHGAITGNNEAQQLLMAENFTKPITILPQLGIDQSIFYPQKQEYRNENWGPIKAHEQKIILFVGRLVPEKGIFHLLNAFVQLKPYHQDWRLIFVGDGSAKGTLLNVIKNLNTSDIECKPACSHHDVAEIMRKASIFVLPSYDTQVWKEQFGHVLIEAMACGIPILTTNAGAIPEVVGSTAIICKQNNIKDLKEQLHLLITQEETRAQLANRGLEYVKDNFTHAAITDATYRFWHNMITST